MTSEKSFLATRNRVQITSHITTRAGCNCQLFRLRPSVVDTSPQFGFAAPDAGEEKFNSRPVTPTFFRNKLFDECAEGLS